MPERKRRMASSLKPDPDSANPADLTTVPGGSQPDGSQPDGSREEEEATTAEGTPLSPTLAPEAADEDKKGDGAEEEEEVVGTAVAPRRRGRPSKRSRPPTQQQSNSPSNSPMGRKISGSRGRFGTGGGMGAVRAGGGEGGSCSPGDQLGDATPAAELPAKRGRGRPPRQRHPSPPPMTGGVALLAPQVEERGQLTPGFTDMDGDDMTQDAPFMDTVVKVFCVHTEPNFSLPWQRKRQFSSSSSGFMVGGRRVLTNAHSVEHSTQVKVKRRGSDVKFLARVAAIGVECDIAMLTVEEEAFWEGVEPLEMGALPRLQDPVTVVGYPIGGDTISVTSGVVSRIEVTAYVHGATELLGIQIDAAINSGNSGGPAFNTRGQCVGITFQSLKNDDAENIGYVIPTPVIAHFINDFEQTGAYRGFPILGVEWQKLESPDLRKALGLRSRQKGVMVRRVEPTAPAMATLQPSDVLLAFDGTPIANDGTVLFRQGERITFSHLVSQKFIGDKVMLEILRNSQVQNVEVKLAAYQRLIPVHIGGAPPPYYIVAGIVFTPVSIPYLKSEYGNNYEYDAPVKILDQLMHSMAEQPHQQLVVISQVLVADVNIGYEDIVNTQVLAFNGVQVQNLRQLAALVESCTEPFLRFDLAYHQLLVLETGRARAATPEILKTHCIPAAMSKDLKLLEAP